MLFYNQVELRQELPFIIRIPIGLVMESAEINTLKTACSRKSYGYIGDSIRKYMRGHLK
jgi:hypothetical protein